MSENCNQNCALAGRVEKLEKVNEQHGETHRRIFDRLTEIEKTNAIHNTQYTAIMEKLDAMDRKSDTLSTRLESIERTSALQAQCLNELNERGKSNKARLDALESKPGKRWEGLVEKAIWAVAAAVIAFLFAKIGL